MRLKLPTLLYFATWAVLIAAPVTLIGLILTGTFDPDAIKAAFPALPISNRLSDTAIIVAGVIGLLPWLFGAWVLYQAQALFALYRADRALTLEAAQTIRDIGVGLVLIVVTQIVARTVQVLILTSANAEGARVLAVQFSFGQFGMLLAAGLMVVIGRSMVEAARAVDDMRGFV